MANNASPNTPATAASPAPADTSRVSPFGISRLTNLSVGVPNGKSKITDDGLRSLAGLSRMQSLSLDGAQIDDAGLAHLRGMTRLTELQICN
jgi:hypothetical protein